MYLLNMTSPIGRNPHAPWITGVGAAAWLALSGCSNSATPVDAGPTDAAVSDNGDGSGDFGSGNAVGCASITDTLTRNGCTNEGCHGNTFVGGLDLVTDEVGSRLVGVRSVTQACEGQLLIDPNSPDDSLLLRLVDPVRYAESQSCSVPMPFGAEGVSEDDVRCFEDWVDALIATVEVDADTVPFGTASDESVLSKVKTLSTGLAVTDADRAAFSEPGGLRQLLTQWVETPEFEQKMDAFLEVALHQQIQGLIGLQVVTRDIGALSGNFEEMFGRTALDLIDRGEPFNRIATTRRWAVTTAILSALRYTDRVNQQGGEFGRLRFDPEDYADWRFVELNQVAPSADLVEYDDLATLRAVQNGFDLINPRVGFFTTPAFFANAETNEDNQFRVTVNQALIVALGRDLQQTDTTPQPSAAGFEAEHSSEQSCRSCHRLLDPMRLHFQRYYDSFYRRTPSPISEAPSFAFLGQTNDGGTLDDFGQALAEHERFPIAWTQRLCFYANSQACSESDPEFQRVVSRFVDSNYNFKALVIELLSSPLITGAETTRTHEDRRFLVSITRRAQLCQLFDARLDTTNVCQDEAVAPVIGLIPDDTFSRGAVDPIQTAVSGGFHFAGAEQVCGRLSSIVVSDGPTGRFDPGRPEEALDRMVESFMGLSPSHPRHEQARRILSDHLTAAISAGAANDDALRSVFTLACLSPDVMAVGL
jgi:hypothetical protein